MFRGLAMLDAPLAPELPSLKTQSNPKLQKDAWRARRILHLPNAIA